MLRHVGWFGSCQVLSIQEVSECKVPLQSGIIAKNYNAEAIEGLWRQGIVYVCIYIYEKCLELSEQFIFNCRIQLKESLKGKKKSL